MVPIRATIWTGVHGWSTVLVGSSTPPPDGKLQLAFRVSRAPVVISVAVIVYALMIMVAACSLSIGGLVFTGVRKVESTIVGALAAMLFSVTVLRNVLPGDPPLGVSADLLIFFWAEIAAAVGLSLLVHAWVKRGPGV
jgi:hypothetical protein